jgi:hypothetical protein
MAKLPGISAECTLSFYKEFAIEKGSATAKI